MEAGAGRRPVSDDHGCDEIVFAFRIRKLANNFYAMIDAVINKSAA
jgi:hypothetical protein